MDIFSANVFVWRDSPEMNSNLEADPFTFPLLLPFL